jgi:hypothetical protein
MMDERIDTFLKDVQDRQPYGFKPYATIEELREELAKRVVELRDAGLIDLEALPPPERQVAN